MPMLHSPSNQATTMPAIATTDSSDDRGAKTDKGTYSERWWRSTTNGSGAIKSRRRAKSELARYLFAPTAAMVSAMFLLFVALAASSVRPAEGFVTTTSPGLRPTITRGNFRSMPIGPFESSSTTGRPLASTNHVDDAHDEADYVHVGRGIQPEDDVQTAARERKDALLQERRREWIDRSVRYYSKVMRRKDGLSAAQREEQDDAFVELATRHYFAKIKIKSGDWHHAEAIYRRAIDELLLEEEEEGGKCDHARLAVSTLLLALLLQRMDDVKGTRSVFLNFFRIAVVENGRGEQEEECACSAKVLQAYALFEMKRGLPQKSLEIVNQAIRMDGNLKPVLEWKQFRDVNSRRVWRALEGGDAIRGCV